MTRLKFLLISVCILAIAVWLQKTDCDLGLTLLALYGLKEDAFSSTKVWIVGASSGIGAALACEYASRGASVVISSRRVAQLEAVANECGGKVLIVPLDVLDLSSQENALDAVITALGGVPEIVVLNAGRSQRQTILDVPLDTTREILELNFFALVSLAQKWSQKLTSSGTGQLVITSSLSGKIGTPAASSYSASKFALHGYFDALRLELHPRINVVLACPGPVVSEIAASAYGAPAVESNSNKMPTQRCAYLMALASYYNLDEVWISRNPELFFTYLFQYSPRLGRALGRRIGPKRVKALRAGQDIFEKSTYTS